MPIDTRVPQRAGVVVVGLTWEQNGAVDTTADRGDITGAEH
jgi:hypothetical protein